MNAYETGWKIRTNLYFEIEKLLIYQFFVSAQLTIGTVACHYFIISLMTTLKIRCEFVLKIVCICKCNNKLKPLSNAYVHMIIYYMPFILLLTIATMVYTSYNLRHQLPYQLPSASQFTTPAVKPASYHQRHQLALPSTTPVTICVTS